MRLPELKKAPNFKIDLYKGESNQKVKCDFVDVTEKGERLGSD